MTKARFTTKAEGDMAGIIDDTIGRWGILQATTYIDELEALANLLAENENIGIKREALLPGLFCFPFKSHVLYYVCESGGIAVLRVLHAKMDAAKHLK
jgi:toxin ParE1/3/4